MGHSLAEHPLPGLDADRIATLAEAGIESLEDLAQAGPERLAEVTGFDAKTALALVRIAAASSGQDSAPKEKVAPGLTRGLRAARALERSVSAVRELRSRLGDGTSHPAERDRARKQLKRLRKRLSQLQREVLAEGVTRASLGHLQAHLAPLRERLQRLQAEEPTKSTLKKVATVAKKARKSL